MSDNIINSKLRPEIRPLALGFAGDFVYSPNTDPAPHRVCFQAAPPRIVLPPLFDENIELGGSPAAQLLVDIAFELNKAAFSQLVAKLSVPPTPALVELAAHFFGVAYLFTSFSPNIDIESIGRLSKEALSSLRSKFSLEQLGASLHSVAKELCKFQAELEGQLTDAAENVESFTSLLLPTHVLLSLGGDDRLRVSPETLSNRYYNNFFGLSSTELLQRGSCTASSPTVHSFQLAEKLRLEWLSTFLSRKSSPTSPLNNSYLNIASNIRNRLEAGFDLEDSDVRIALTPSGTDAEILATLLALARHPEFSANTLKVSSSEPLVTSIVCAAGEVGSGTQHASSLQYFSPDVPIGHDDNVKVGSQLKGVPKGIVEFVGITARTNDGVSNEEHIDDVERQIEDRLKVAIEHKNRIGVIHLVHFSKTGIMLPSIPFLSKIKSKYGSKLVAVVDACQLRCGDTEIRDLVNEGFVVLITGSKFIGGAPFCGAVLLRGDEAAAFTDRRSRDLSSFTFGAGSARMAPHKYNLYNKSNEVPPFPLPPGVAQFFSGFDVDPRMTSLSEALPPYFNFGLLLRWRTALFEFERLKKYKVDIRKWLCEEWVRGSEAQILNSPSLRILHPSETRSEILSKSVISFFVLHPNGDYFSRDELKLVHELLNIDLSAKLLGLSEHDARALGRRILTGQPVLIDSAGRGVLRLALSMPVIVEMCENMSAKKILSEEQAIIKKLELLSKHFDSLKTFAGRPF